MAELLEVDVVEGESVVAQVGEDVFEEVGVPVSPKIYIEFPCFLDIFKPVNKYSTSLIPTSLYSSTQETSEECILYLIGDTNNLGQ